MAKRLFDEIDYLSRRLANNDGIIWVSMLKAAFQRLGFPTNTLKLFVYDWESYDYVDEKTLPGVEGENNDRKQSRSYPAQIVWIANGKIIHNTFIELDKLDVLTEYTQDLLRRDS